MKVRIDHIKEKVYSAKLVLLDISRVIQGLGLPSVSAWQTKSHDRFPAMRVRLGNPPPDGTMRDLGASAIALTLKPWPGHHVILNAKLIFHGLKKALGQYRVETAESTESGRGSELATRVTVDLSEVLAPKMHPLAEEVPASSKYAEGSVEQILINRYERDRRAREQCIRAYGAACVVCGFDFGQVYGDVMRGFIQVHHLVPLATIGANYKVNPIRDLRPVCANCHAFVHRRTPPFSIEEARRALRAQRK